MTGAPFPSLLALGIITRVVGTQTSEGSRSLFIHSRFSCASTLLAYEDVTFSGSNFVLPGVFLACVLPFLRPFLSSLHVIVGRLADRSDLGGWAFPIDAWMLRACAFFLPFAFACVFFCLLLATASVGVWKRNGAHIARLFVLPSFSVWYNPMWRWLLDVNPYFLRVLA